MINIFLIATRKIIFLPRFYMSNLFIHHDYKIYIRFLSHLDLHFRLLFETLRTVLIFQSLCLTSTKSDNKILSGNTIKVLFDEATNNGNIACPRQRALFVQLFSGASGLLKNPHTWRCRICSSVSHASLHVQTR